MRHINRKIAAYEKEGMWSHAAELADTHAEKIKDNRLKMRAIDNYEKAGYNANTLEKHAKRIIPILKINQNRKRLLCIP